MKKLVIAFALLLAPWGNAIGADVTLSDTLWLRKATHINYDVDAWDTVFVDIMRGTVQVERVFLSSNGKGRWGGFYVPSYDGNFVAEYNAVYSGDTLVEEQYFTVLDTAAFRGDISTCLGTGSDTLDIIVFDGDTTAVEGVDLCIYNPTKTAKAVPSVTTDVNGYCQVMLDPGNYPTWCQRLGVIQSEWDTVTVPSDGGRDTIWVVAYDPGDAPSANLVRLDCTFRGLDGAQYFREFATFSISDENVWDTSQTPAVLISRRPVTIQIDTGTVIVDLTPSELMAKVQGNVIVKDSILWTVHIYQAGRTDLREYEFYLPDSTGTIHLWDLLKP